MQVYCGIKSSGGHRPPLFGVLATYANNCSLTYGRHHLTAIRFKFASTSERSDDVAERLLTSIFLVGLSGRTRAECQYGPPAMQQSVPL